MLGGFASRGLRGVAGRGEAWRSAIAGVDILIPAIQLLCGILQIAPPPKDVHRLLQGCIRSPA